MDSVFDYDRQVWTRDGRILPCGHPDTMRPGCCAAGAVDRAPLCDFCADPSAPVRWRYPASDFAVSSPDPSTGLASRGEWAACDPCHALIGADQWAALAVRSARCYAVKFEIPADEILPAIVLLQSLFGAHRTGAPTRV